MIEFNDVLSAVPKKRPLIHCITNPISINQCANTILAVGGKPIMAEHPKEVSDITDNADALMINLGNITDARMESIMISVDVAKRKSIPIVLDAVGVACSKLRKEYVCSLFGKVIPSVIKGNYSEINALLYKEYSSKGVDADASLKKNDIKSAAVKLAKKYHTLILATGKEDIITDGCTIVTVKNGCKQLSEVTGTGCMLGALCASLITVNCSIESVVLSAAILGICGELSSAEKGNGTFMVNLLDNLSTIDFDKIKKYIRLEEEIYEI